MAALPDTFVSIADLGSGAGIPGLVIALNRPDLEVRLVERSAKRADGLARAVTRLGLPPRVTVWKGDAREIATRTDWPGPVDAVVCRSFSPPDQLFKAASPLVAPGGQILISEPPGSDGSRWQDKAPPGIKLLGVQDGIATFSVFHVKH